MGLVSKSNAGESYIFENKEMVPKQFKTLIKLLIHDSQRFFSIICHLGSILNHMKEKQNITITNDLYWLILQSNFIEITLRHGCSPVNLLIFSEHLLLERLWTAASVIFIYLWNVKEAYVIFLKSIQIRLII